jgi:anti-anti-sigma factor
MEQSFTLDTVEHEAYTVLSLKGAFATVGFSELKKKLDSILNQPAPAPRFLLLDLSGTTLLTSSCLEAIYLARKSGEQNNWECVIVSPAEDVVELFTVTGFDRFIPVYAAIDAFLTEKGLA